MSRPPRQKNDPSEETIYHTWSQVVQQKFYIEEEDKEKFLEILAKLKKTFFVEIISCKVMDNHIHLEIKIYVPDDVTEEELERRFKNLYPDRRFPNHKAEEYKEKWGDLSKFMGSLKQRFSIYMNRKHGWRGHFWAERFGSNIQADENAALHCASYIELNHTKVSGIEPTAESPCYGGIPYILWTQNRGNFYSLKEITRLAQGIFIPEWEKRIEKRFGTYLESFMSPEEKQGFVKYLAFVYMKNEEREFLKRGQEIFTKQGIMGSRESIQTINTTLNHPQDLTYEPTELSASLYFARN